MKAQNSNSNRSEFKIQTTSSVFGSMAAQTVTQELAFFIVKTDITYLSVTKTKHDQNTPLDLEKNYYSTCRLKGQKWGHQSLISLFFLRSGVFSILINEFTK